MSPQTGALRMSDSAGNYEATTGWLSASGKGANGGNSGTTTDSSSMSAADSSFFTCVIFSRSVHHF